MPSEKHARTALKNLKPRWPEIEKELEKDRRKLAGSIAEGDPLLSSVDLLLPLASERHEETHTRALAYLLNPQETHGFGNTILKLLLERVGAHKAIECLRGAVEVSPERLIDSKEAKHRFDIRAEIRHRDHSFLIIIENKIGAPVSQEQLARYEKNARERSPGTKPILILLSTKEWLRNSERSNWNRIHYLELASILRRAWLENKEAVGRGWLALYITSILRGVLKLELIPHRIKSSDLNVYLGSGNAEKIRK